jgi:hypothetical protein
LEKLGPNEVRLTWEDTVEYPKAHTDFQMNLYVLRSWISLNRPIRDASPGNYGGMYTNFERETLRDAGWISWTRSDATWWIPPASYPKNE